MALLRAATPADVESLLPMVADLYRLEGIDWEGARFEAALRALLADASLGLVLIAVDGDGYAMVTFGFDVEYGGRDAFLTDLYLRPQARGRGLGARMLDEIETLSRDAGAGALHLMVRPENSPALELYANAGFHLVPRRVLSKRLS